MQRKVLFLVATGFCLFAMGTVAMNTSYEAAPDVRGGYACFECITDDCGGMTTGQNSGDPGICEFTPDGCSAACVGVNTCKVCNFGTVKSCFWDVNGDCQGSGSQTCGTGATQGTCTLAGDNCTCQVSGSAISSCEGPTCTS